MKLLSIRLPLDNLPRAFDAGGGVQREVNFAEPLQATYGWRVLIHGQVVTVIVPTLGENHIGGRQPTRAGAYTFARARCVEHWDSREPKDYAKSVQDYESEPVGPIRTEVAPEMDHPNKAVK